jgi:magnesium-protoporphyrin O-methyltransferase
MKISSTAALLVAAAAAPSTTAFSTAHKPLTTPTLSSTTLFSSVDDKTEVREYFNNEGFNRWNKIYSDSDEVNKVQLDIRNGHDQTIQKILNWINDDGDIEGKTVCDCGCGVGSLAIPLAQMGELLIYPYVDVRQKLVFC